MNKFTVAVSLNPCGYHKPRTMKDQVRDFIGAGEFSRALDLMESNGIDCKDFRDRLNTIDAMEEKVIQEARTFTEEEFTRLTNLEDALAKDILKSLR